MLHAYAALFFWSFLAATLVPLGSEPPLAFLVEREGAVALPVLVATAGNALGACTTYGISRRAVKALAGRRKLFEGRERALWLFNRYGQPVLLLSWVPVLGDGLVVLAGATQMRFTRFCFWMTLGKGLRYLAVALVVSNLL